jgi:hypothetical protein
MNKVEGSCLFSRFSKMATNFARENDEYSIRVGEQNIMETMIALV